MFCSRSALPFGVPFEVPARRGSGSADVILGARGTNGRPPHWRILGGSDAGGRLPGDRADRARLGFSNLLMAGRYATA